MIYSKFHNITVVWSQVRPHTGQQVSWGQECRVSGEEEADWDYSHAVLPSSPRHQRGRLQIFLEAAELTYSCTFPGRVMTQNDGDDVITVTGVHHFNIMNKLDQIKFYHYIIISGK